MAEQIPYALAEGLISNLASLAFGEIGRILGVEDELEGLKETLELIQAVLSDAEERQHEDPAVKIWIRWLREVVHDADNLFDDLRIHDFCRKVSKANSGSKVSRFFSSENPLAVSYDVANKIKEIQKKCNKIAEDMSKFNLNRTVVTPKKSELAWRETSSYVLQSEIIGREGNENDIMNLLNQAHSNQSVSLVAIVAMGGLGKTALAQLVYNKAKEQKIFQKYMWVCISEDFEVKAILKKMLKSLKMDEVGDIELDILQQMLREELNGQRYMLVLDDVWNESQLKWNALRTYLMCGGGGSKILVTTRSKSVAQTMGINTPYVLEGLTKEQSWTLLKKVTFGEDTSRMSPNLVSIGEKIAEKCRGVPLAIRTMGGLLQSKHEESEWMRILDGDFWRLCGEKESIMPVLKLSYQNLPLGLRQCFAYCYLYPKDWEIQKNELIQLWMAQGYLESSIEMQSMEDVGNQYIKILLMRSFFQDASMNEYGDIRSFKMHDLMHDLANSIVGNDCYLDSEGKRIVGRPMHVAFLSRAVCSLDLLDANHLRTIICRNMEAITNPSFIKCLKYLRVLNLSHSSITQLPESIDEVKHLKCLDLSYCKKLISLPKSVGNLVSLQTLNLRECQRLVFPIEIIVKLINLRHLDIDHCGAFEEMMPKELEKLTSLQTLSSFVVGDDGKTKSGKLNELKELNNLTDGIWIRNLGSVKDVGSESQETNLKSKEHIQHLRLWWGEEAKNKNSDMLQFFDNLCPHPNLKQLRVKDYPGVRFSNWLPSLTNIIRINFSSFSNCQYLPPLERLPYLKTLEIWNMDKLECMHYEEISNVFFPSLETLRLQWCQNLRGWQRLGDENNANNTDNHLSLPHFPRLSLLVIDHCPNLTCMPTLLHPIKRLSFIRGSTKLVEKCLGQLESSSSYPPSTLKNLSIGLIKEVEAMAEDWMRNLTSLKSLHLRGKLIVPTLLRHLQHLPSELQELKIWRFKGEKLDLWKDEEDNITQRHGPPHGLRSLQQLIFSHCKMTAISEQIGDLQSLGFIEFFECNELQSLPKAMCCLTNLQTLRITKCSILSDRCQADIGQDWPKIAHIPNIDIC